MEFRLLKEDEIELRVGNVTGKGYTLLLYKNARADMNILDETVGAENWQREHYECKGNLFCRVGIYSEKLNSFVFKSDCGVESNTEKEKGEASDSFKRACTNWGIGRELYTSPFIFIPCEMIYQNGKYVLPDSEKYRKFKVTEIDYVSRKITKLVIVDSKTGETAFSIGKQVNMAEKKASQYTSGVKCEECDENITDKVAKYSKDTFGKLLCYKCQQRQKVSEKEI